GTIFVTEPEDLTIFRLLFSRGSTPVPGVGNRVSRSRTFLECGVAGASLSTLTRDDNLWRFCSSLANYRTVPRLPNPAGWQAVLRGTGAARAKFRTISR